MFVERLDLFGFKSFPNRTEIPLARGITAIVGPNGCGKSNISDALRWVLGEQNARTLRGEKIQDVIFKGSGAAKPLGMAEVSLTVVNDDGSLPVEYTHVGVSRRIFRSGESEFSINKIPCRLKDIRDLFSGTGLGSHGYAVIERDMIDQVLSDRDDARRFLFEEAAGIIRYKQRRKESERRLEGVEQDLTRIEDMIREITRVVRSLARQAGKVRRWRRLKEELSRYEVLLAWERWRELRAQSLSSDDLHRRREAERADLSSRLAVLDARREALRLRLLEESDRLEQAQHALDTAGRAFASAREEIGLLSARRESWAGEEGDLRARLERHRARLSGLGQERSDLGPAIERLRRLLSEAEERASEAARVRAEAERALREVRVRLSQAQQMNLDLTTTRTSNRQDLESKRERKAASAARRDELAARGDLLASREEQAAADLNAAEGQLAAQEEARSRLEGERTGAEAQARELREMQAATSRRLAEAERARAGLASRLEVLEEQHQRHAGFDAAVRHLLEHRAEYAGLIGVVGEEVRVLAGREMAGRAVLGDRVQWVLVEDEERAVELVGRLRELGLGGLTFFPLKEAGMEPAGGDVEGLFACSEAAAPFVGYLSRTTRLCASLAEARRIAREESVRAVTSEGDAVERDSVFRLAGGESQDAEILRRESEMPGLRQSLEEAAAVSQRLERERGELSDREAALVAATSALEQSLSALARARAETTEARTQTRTELAMLREERERLERERTALEEEIGFLEEESARLEGAVSRFDQESSEAQLTFEELSRRAEAEEANKDARVREAAEREMEALRLRNDLGAQEARLAALEREAGELEREIAEAAARMEERAREDEAAARRITELKDGMGGLEAERTAREASLQEVRAHHQEVQDGLFQLDAELKEAREKFDSVVQTLHAEDMERMQTRGQADQIRDRIREEYAIDLETWAPPPEKPVRRRRRARRRPQGAGDGRTGTAAADSGPAGAEAGEGSTEESATAADLDEAGLDADLDSEADLDLDEGGAEAFVEGDEGEGAAAPADAAAEEQTAPFTPEQRAIRMADLRRAIEGMGNLNFVAEEEYRTEKERLEFHTKQAEDLKAARQDLLEAIRRINETAGEMFRQTFEAVQENFRTTFDQLFPGGEASLTLQAGDPLEGDIEISARPRGKKLESIRLLSSGERALTAIALLFGIYLAKPSPVCLLDEVDAPLDDANLDRFLNLVRHFSRRTQFITITHNKQTMEAADRLFGVTMEEPGISKIVSVHMDGRNAELTPATSAELVPAAKAEGGSGEPSSEAEAASGTSSPAGTA